MKSIFLLLCIALLTVSPGLLIAEEPGGDPISAHLFPPEFLMRHRVKISLTDQQIKKIRTRIKEAGPKVRQEQSRLNDAKGKLSKLLIDKKVDEEAALKQLNKVLETEKEMKRLHFQVMIQIRNILSAEQQKIASKLKQAPQYTKGIKQHAKAKVKILSPKALQTAVDALKKKDIAWRKIAWKTCLLDGLKASREQNKPIMLWIFIDRPIDDERC